MAKITAVIDIGSNSARLVVYEKSSRFAFHLIHETTSRVRLPQNAYKHNGFLQDDAMKRTSKVLDNFLSIASSFKARKILCVATSALRDAPNRQIFIKQIRDKLGLNIKVINGVKEAMYSARACLNLLPPKEAMVVDIGGGSTEFSYIIDKQIKNSISLPLGTVRIKELYFDCGDIEGAKKYIDEQLENLPLVHVKELIGVGGTFRSISKAVLKTKEYPLDILHGFTFATKELEKIIKRILHATTKELNILGIKSQRYDTIKPGALIIERLLLKIYTLTTLTVSGVGVREGVYLSDLLRHQNYRFPDNYNPSVRFLIDTMLIEKQFSNQLAYLSRKIFKLIYQDYNINDKYQTALIIAAKLSPIGSAINFYASHQHSYYLIQNSLKYGFSHEEIILIATLVKFVKKKSPTKSHLQTYKIVLPDSKTVEILSSIISISTALLSHRPKKLTYNITFKDKCLHISSQDDLYLVKDSLMKLEYPDNFSVKISVP